MGPKIAVIGGGIGGLRAAVALARKGLAAEVFEQAPVLEEAGAGWAVAERVDGAGTGRAGWQGDAAGGEAGRAGY
jgi:salicylate hydroxylase